MNWPLPGCTSSTCVNGLVAGQVSLVAEGSLAPVTLVWLVTVHLEHVALQSFLLCVLRVAFVTEESAVFWMKMRRGRKRGKE